jgi:K(+)-stimulated pyrophosphate-energized sodium pump
MNILIKLTCLIGLVIAPILGEHAADNDKMTSEVISITSHTDKTEKEVQKTLNINLNKNDDAATKAVVTTTTLENEIKGTKDKIIEGTAEEVEKKVSAIDKELVQLQVGVKKSK